MNKTSTRCKRTRIFTRTAIALAVASVLTAAPAVQAKNPFIPDFSLEDATVGQTVTGDSGSSAQGNATGTKGADGSRGDDGTKGADGKAGADAKTTLVTLAVKAETPCGLAFCGSQKEQRPTASNNRPSNP